MCRKTVIVAAGDFPRKGGVAWKMLAAATRVVACDSAADAYRRAFRKWPDVIIGDLDSTVLSAPSRTGAAREGTSSTEVIHISDQDTNDLEKAMAYCAQQGWRNPVIVGAT